MDWTLAEKFGASFTILAALLLGLAWVGRRLIGKGGIVETVGSNVAAKLVEFMDTTQGFMRHTESLHASCQEAQRQHNETMRPVCQQVHGLALDAERLREAGLQGCDLLDSIAEQTQLDFTPHVDRIRRTVEQIGRTPHGE
ncbi:MAG: hypothetical protein ACOY3P_14375 [Planctomycetota bacterium]